VFVISGWWHDDVHALWRANCLDNWNPFWCINIPKCLLLLLSIVLIYVFILFLPEARKCDFLLATVCVCPTHNFESQDDDGMTMCMSNSQLRVTRWWSHDVLSQHVCTTHKFMLPKRRFWKDEQKMKSGFSTDFSMVRSPKWVLTTLKSDSKIRISSFVHPSKIFVWDG
jgi:hypothetical protein